MTSTDHRRDCCRAADQGLVTRKEGSVGPRRLRRITRAIEAVGWARALTRLAVRGHPSRRVAAQRSSAMRVESRPLRMRTERTPGLLPPPPEIDDRAPARA